MTLVTRCAALLAGLTLAIGAVAQDKPTRAEAGGAQVDNPEYKHWSRFKPGSFSKTKIVTDMPGAQTELLTTTTLKEVAADSATVEVVTVTKMGDQEMKAPPVTNKIPAKVAAADAAKYDNPEGKVKDGTEEVEAAGKKWKTKWVEVVTPAGDMKITAKIWTSEDVPGRIVKLTSETAGQMSTKSTGSLIEVKADLK